MIAYLSKFIRLSAQKEMCSIKLTDIVCQFFIDKLIVDRDVMMNFRASNEISFYNFLEIKSWSLKK